jgi:ABC-type branched-subunit amino acid transport system ATPase component
MLTSFHIKNFRSCKDVKLESMGPMLGLVGRNGAGKTTILRGIEWVVATALSRVEFSEGEDAESSLDPQAQVKLEVDEYEYCYTWGVWTHGESARVDGSTDEESLSVRERGAHWHPLLDRERNTIVLNGRERRVLMNHGTAAMMPALASLLPESDPLHVHLRRVMAVFRGVRYYLGHGIFDPAFPFAREQRGPISRLVYERWTEAHVQTGPDYLSILLRLIHAERTTPDIFAELKSRVGPEGLGLLSDIRVVTLGDVGGAGRGRIYFDVVFVPVGLEVELSLDQLSGGTRQMLYLMLALLFDQSSTMLVEQPEDGVHPVLLAKLIDIFRVNADPTQIILTSHSSTVLSNLRPEDVRLVEMRDGSTQVRALTGNEVQRAQEYMQREGSLAEFLELIQD